MRLLKRLDRNRRVTAVPYQKSGVPESAGLTPEDCRKAAWAMPPEPHRASRHQPRLYRGAGAINAAVSVAAGTPLPYRFYALPGVRRLQDLAYDRIAGNRRLLPADTPYCRQYPEECR